MGRLGRSDRNHCASTALPSPKAITIFRVSGIEKSKKAGLCCCATPKASCPRQWAEPTPQLDPTEWDKSFPLPVSERELLNFKYCNSQLFFPIKLPFYGIVWNLNTMNFIANLTFICNVYLLPGEWGRAVCFLLCQTGERYSRTLPIISTKKNQIYLPWLERVIFTGYLCTFTS